MSFLFAATGHNVVAHQCDFDLADEFSRFQSGICNQSCFAHSLGNQSDRTGRHRRTERRDQSDLQPTSVLPAHTITRPNTGGVANLLIIPNGTNSFTITPPKGNLFFWLANL